MLLTRRSSLSKAECKQPMWCLWLSIWSVGMRNPMESNAMQVKPSEEAVAERLQTHLHFPVKPTERSRGHAWRRHIMHAIPCSTRTGL